MLGRALLLLLLLVGPAGAARFPSTSPALLMRPVCDIQWLAKPKNGVVTSDALYVQAVPAEDIEIRAIGPNGWGEAEAGLGWCEDSSFGVNTICTADSDCTGIGTEDCAFTDDDLATTNDRTGYTGPWDTHRSDAGGFSTVGAAGIAIEANQAVVFRWASLSGSDRKSWEIQCKTASMHDFAVAHKFGQGSSPLLPAVGASERVVILMASDAHIIGAYANFVTADGDAEVDCDGDTVAGPETRADADCDNDGMLDAREHIERNLNTNRWMAVYARRRGAQLAMFGGDDQSGHCGVGNCSFATDIPNAIGPVNASLGSPLDAHDPELDTDEQLERDLGYGTAIGYFDGVQGYQDEHLEWEEARFAFFVNRLNELCRIVSCIAFRGNHDPGQGWGEAAYGGTSTYTYQNDPEFPSQQFTVPFVYTKYQHNPNAVYNTGVNLPSDEDFAEEAATFFGFTTGKLCFYHPDEYHATDGTDPYGVVTTAGTSIPNTACIEQNLPSPNCSAANTARTDPDLTPDHAWEWTLGSVQKTHYGAFMDACEQPVSAFWQHHAPGGCQYPENSHAYGRGTHSCVTRYCRRTSDDAILTAAMLTAAPSWYTGAGLDGDGKVPVLTDRHPFPSTLLPTAAPESRLCDRMDDGTENGTAYAEDLDLTRPFRADHDFLHSELVAWKSGDPESRVGIGLFAHDHANSYGEKDDGSGPTGIHYANTGIAGAGPVGAGWGCNDKDGDGFVSFALWHAENNDPAVWDALDSRLEDYYNASVPEGNGCKDGAFEAVDTNVAGWAGKSFTILTVEADGTAILEWVATPGHDMCFGTGDPNCPARAALDGQVVFSKVLTQ